MMEDLPDFDEAHASLPGDITPSDDRRWMWEALAEAKRAYDMGEVPVGAVVVRDGQVIGRGHNMVETLGDSTAHAEIIAIGAASRTVGDWRLNGATLYVTLEPCVMCAGAIDLSRLSRLYYAAGDSRKGAFGSTIDVCAIDGFCTGLVVDYGLLIDEASILLEDFFRARRS
jgi:tRNA(adenine34) deaminase